MSPPIWTPGALRSEGRSLAGPAWRLVEAQHRVSTLKLVDTLAEQVLLEGMLDAAKPLVPPDCAHLDYLLSTPFRYRPYPQGSRFRRAGLTPGVWYGSERVETALAEMAFYRVLFHAESPATPFPDDPADYTAFAADLATPAALDLTQGALARDVAHWTHPNDYAPCQALAEGAREAGIEVLRSRSVRAPDGGANLSVLTCRAFAAPQPTDRQTWRLRLGSAGVQAMRDHPPGAVEFPRDGFAADPRVAGMNWSRPRAR
jgi:hypothetical protein